jgi:hypothetical protein
MKLKILLAVCCLFVLLPTVSWAESVDIDNEMPNEVIENAALVASDPIVVEEVRNPRTVIMNIRTMGLGIYS